MKIINSHYISLPAPYDILMAPDGRVYTQIGTLAVVEESKEKRDGYGIVVHHHPVVMSATEDWGVTPIDDIAGTDSELVGIPTPANGEVLYRYELKDCQTLCTTDHREVDLVQFNTVILASYLNKNAERPIDVGASIDYMKACGIHIAFPEKTEQTVEMTMIDYSGMYYLQSNIIGLFFMIPFGKAGAEGKVTYEGNSLVLEFVNQARAYRKVNPNYHFRFTAPSIEGFSEKLNEEMKNYLADAQ